VRQGADAAKAPRPRRSAWYWCAQQLAWAVMAGLFRARVFGRRNLPERGGAILACNHQSYLDPIFLGLRVTRPVHYMARESLFRWPVFGALIRSLNAFPVKRGLADLAAMREAVRRLRAGAFLVVFPEGTRTRTGEMGPLHAGVGAMARRAGVPVVPAVVEGAFAAWPRHRRWPAPKTVWVAFGRPLAAPAGHGEERTVFQRHLTRRMRALQRRLRRIKAGVPPAGCRPRRP